MKIWPSKIGCLTLIGMRGDTFICHVWIRFCQLNFYQKFPNFLEIKLTTIRLIWHPAKLIKKSYKEIPLEGAKNEHFLLSLQIHFINLAIQPSLYVSLIEIYLLVIWFMTITGQKKLQVNFESYWCIKPIHFWITDQF